MKLNKQLKIDGVQYPVITENVTLELNAYGRARFEIRANSAPSGLVEYSLGRGSLAPVFYGGVINAHETAPGRYEVISRELSAALEAPAQLSLRHVTARMILDQITERIGTKFITPSNAEYVNRPIPHFVNRTTCRRAIEEFKIWGVQRGVWVQLSKTEIWWGDWDDTPFSKIEPIGLNWKTVTRQELRDQSFHMPVVPTCRPGVRIDENKYIQSIEFLGEEMRVKWLKLFNKS